MADSEQRSEFDDLDVATVAVRDLIASSRELVGRMARMMDMNPTDMSAVGALTLNGPMGVVELADHLGIRSASATAVVDRLERAGHVVRIRDTVDRRRVQVVETPTAREAGNRAWGPVIRQIDDVSRALGEQEREIVCRFLADVATVNERGGRHDRTAAGATTGASS